MPAPLRKLLFSFLPASALLAALLPTVLALFLARSASMRQQREAAITVAQQILIRTDAIRTEMLKAAGMLAKLDASDRCSTKGIHLMRLATLHAALADVGYARDGHLVCSSFGAQDMPLGTPSYISNEGWVMRSGLHPDGVQDISLVAATDPDTGLTIFVHPSLTMDGVPQGESWQATVVGLGKHTAVLAKLGDYDPAWLSHVGPGATGTFIYKQHIVAWAHSKAGGAYLALAAMPGNMWQPALRKSTLLALVLGLPCSGLLAFALRRMINYNTTMRHLLRQALKFGELSLAYQPIVALADGRWVGAEALMRWRRPNGEVIPPDVFIPIAEKSGLMPAIREYLIRTFEHDAPALFQQHPDFHIALNFCAEDFCTGNLASRLQLALDRSGAKPHNLQAEVTERLFMHMEDACPSIGALRKLGVAVALDDFGTGFSSLSYLNRMAFDYLKIDKSFVSTIDTEAVTSKVVDHIIEMAKSLDMHMIAEGVETTAQADYLSAHGVQLAQGWLYAKALPMEKLLDQLGSASTNAR